MFKFFKKVGFGIFFMIVFFVQNLNAQIIGTFAGSDFIGDGKQATQAVLKQTLGVSVDKQGNVYFAEQGHSLIRRVDAITGIITSYAGNGNAGNSGDGGLATNALLYYPRAIRFDTAGNGYILDGVQTIRKISKLTGLITTIVGNGIVSDSNIAEVPALKASFSSPLNFTLDRQGNIFIVDRGTNTLRKVSASTGIISVIAGNGTAGYAGDGGLAANALLNRPTCVEVDDSSNIYIADNNNFRIRKISAKTGIITTIAGDGTQGQIASDTTLATFAKIGNINALHIDKLGNIYFDMSGGFIKKIEKSSGLVFVIIGMGNTTFTGDGGLAINATINNPRSITTDSAGNLYFSDYGNRIRKVDASTTIINTIAGFGDFGGDNGSANVALLNYPQGLGIDKDANVYIADKSNNRVRKVNASDGIITTIIGNGGTDFNLVGNPSSVPVSTVQIQNPTNALVDSLTGNLFIQSYDIIYKFTKSTGMVNWFAGGRGGSTAENVAATTVNIYPFSDLAIDKSGNIYTVEGGPVSTIRKITASTGKINTIVNSARTAGFSGDGGAAISAKISNPYCAAFDNVGNMYIGDLGNNRIRKVNAATGIITTIAGTGVAGFSGDNGLAIQAQIGYPVGIAVDNLSNVIFVDGTRIRKINTTTGIITTIAGTESSSPFVNNVQALDAKIQPRNLAVDKFGNIYLSEPNRNAVRIIYNTPSVNLSIDNSANFDLFSACVGNASAAQSFTVNGNVLSDSIRINSSADFEISLVENGVYSKTIVIPPSNGSVGSTKLYSRLIAKPTLGNYTGQITVTSKNANGRSLTTNARVVTIPSTPSITYTGKNRFCVGQNATLKSNSMEGNQWYANNKLISGAIDSIYITNTSGDYTVAKNINGCQGAQSAVVSLIADNFPQAPVVQDTNYCLGVNADTLKASVLLNNALLWYGNSQSGGTATTASPKPTTSATGTSYYYVSQKTNVSGCESVRAKIGVLIKSLPSTPILSRDTANYLVSAAVIGNTWYKDGSLLSDTSQKIKPTVLGLYTVKTTQNGCPSSLSTPYYYIVTDVINLNADEFIKLAPNPFVNQLNLDFVIKGYQRLNMEIYDIATGSRVVNKQALSPGTPIFLGQLSAGTYIVKILSTDNKVAYQFKMVKL